MSAVVWRRFSVAFHQGQSQIFVLRLLRMHRPSHAVQRQRPRTWSPWLAWSIGPLLIPLLSEFAFTGLGGHLTSTQWLLVVILTCVNLGAMGSAAMAWNYATRRAHTVDDLLRQSVWRDMAVAPLYWGLNRWRQAILPLVLTIIPLGAMSYRVAVHGGQPASDWSVAVVGSWTLALTGNDVWWLIIPPMVIWRLRRANDLSLRWHDPAHTPGIRTFAEGYGFSSFFVALGALAVTLPGLLGHPFFGVATPWLFGSLVGLSLWIGIVTQLVIYMIVRRARLQAMDSLDIESSILAASSNNRPMPTKRLSQTSESLALYSSLAAAGNLPYGSGAVVQYFAAIAGAVAGFALQRR